jgi:hypothetical protein
MVAGGMRTLAANKLPGDPGDFNGACTLGEFCLFYLWDNQGSVADFNFSVYDLNVLTGSWGTRVRVSARGSASPTTA